MQRFLISLFLLGLLVVALSAPIFAVWCIQQWDLQGWARAGAAIASIPAAIVLVGGYLFACALLVGRRELVAGFRSASGSCTARGCDHTH